MRILTFGSDTNLLLPEDPANESQYRQRRYCELLDQQREFVILNSSFPPTSQRQVNGRLKAVSAAAPRLSKQFRIAYHLGCELARKLQPDLVEYQDPQRTGLPASLLAKKLGCPLVGGVFNDMLDNTTHLRGLAHRLAMNRLGHWVLRQSKCIRCDSAETTEALRRKGHRDVHYIPFFIPWLETFAVSDQTQRARLARWHHDPLLLCVARLSEEKNISLLLQAFAQLTARVGRAHLAIAGTGPLKAGLISQATRTGIGDRVTWLGEVDYHRLPQLYRESNIFVLPSNSETSARVLILAQASRLPTVSTATSGSSEIVKDARNGYITPVGDVRALHDTLHRFVTDRELYAQMLNSAHHYDWAQHSEAAVMPRLLEFYKYALRSK